MKYEHCGNTPQVCCPFQGPSSAPTPVSLRPFSGPSTTPNRADQRPVSGPHLSYSLTNHKTAYFYQWQTTHKPSWPNKKWLRRPVKSVSTHTADNALTTGYHSCTTGGRAINFVICWSAVVNQTQPYSIPYACFAWSMHKMILTGEIKVLGGRRGPVPLCLPQIPCRQLYDPI